MSLEQPRMLNKHFAEDADPQTLHTVPDVPNQDDIAQKPSLASYSTGFPPRSMAPPQAGGQPFYGQDVNGIFKDVSANVQYMQAGNYYPFDANFQTAVGGYNKFAVLLNTEDGKLYQSLVDNNTAPLSDTKSWFFFTDGKYLQLTGGELSGKLAVRSDQNCDLSLEAQSGGKNGYTIRRAADSLFIYSSKNGVTAAYYIAQYKQSTDTWDFNVANLTNRTVPVATVQTEYWYVGGSKEKPLVVEHSKEYVFYNIYENNPVMFIPQIYIDKTQSTDGKARWVEINGRFDNSGANDGLSFKTAEVLNDNGSISYEVGINVSTSSIVAPNRQLSQIPGKWIETNITKAPFRIKVIKFHV